MHGKFLTKILHSLPVYMVVKGLSPEIIFMSKSAAPNSSSTKWLSGFSLFSRTKNPKKFKLSSNFSRVF